MPASIDFSVRIYTRLLAAYPEQFRAEYGPHMAQVFRDVCRRESRRGGLPAVVALWVRTSLDLIRTSVEEHIDRGIDMTRENFVRWSGWAMMAGAVLFAAGFIIGSFDPNWTDPIGGADAFYEISQVAGIALGELLFVIGVIGLRSGYASRSGSLGRALLLIAVIGGVASLGGILFMSLPSLGWDLWVLGLLTLTIALTAYGVVAIRQRVFSRWNFAPLLTGMLIPAVIGFAATSDLISGALADWAFVLGISASAVGLILLGYRMQVEVTTTSQAIA